MKNKHPKTKILLMSALLATLFCFGRASSASAATYYVDGANGNDSNNGTALTSAFKTIQKCLNVVQAGSSCLVRGGTYGEALVLGASGTASSKITIQNYNGEKVVVNPGTSKALRANGTKNYYVIDGLQFISPSHNTYNYGDDFTVDFRDTFSGNGDDPNQGSSYNIIRNCYIEGAIQMYGHNNLVENCTLNGKNLWTNGIKDRDGVSHDNTYRKNTISSYIYRGIWTMRKTSNILMEGNTIHDIIGGPNDVSHALDCDGADVAVQNCTLRGNTIYSCKEKGITMEDAFNGIVENNIVHDVNAGISVINYGIEPSGWSASAEYRTTATNLMVRNNVVYNTNSAGIIFYASSGNKVYNNTIYNSKAAAGYFSAIAMTPIDEYTSNNIEIKNNIVAESGPYAIWIKNTANTATTGLQFANNLYYSSATNYKTHNIEGKNGGLYTFAQYQSATGQEKGSSFANPLFVNASGADFHLQASSPAIDKGATLSGFAADLSGATRPQSSAWDMGAYEYGATPPPATTPACTALTFKAGTATPNPASANGTYTISCDYGVAGIDSVHADNDLGACTYVSWNGSAAQFACSAGASGTRTNTCSTVTGTSANSCAQRNNINSVTVAAAAPAPVVYTSSDVAALLANWGKTGTGIVSDVNNDSKVNDQDLAIMMGSFK